MGTRYFEMIRWSIQYGAFCVAMISLFSLLENSRHNKAQIQCNKARLSVFYVSDFIFMALLLFVIGFRCNTGSDFFNYYTQYVNVDRYFSSFLKALTFRFQSGILLLSYVIKKTLKHDYAFFPVAAALLYLPMFHLIRKRSKNVKVSVAVWILMGFLLMTTNIMKQSFSMVIILYVYEYAERKKFLSAFLLSVLSCMFHLSAAYACIIILTTRRLRPMQSLLYVVTFVSAVLTCGMRPLAMFLAGVLPPHYQVYLNSILSGETNDRKLSLGGLITVIVYLYFIWHVTRRSYLKKIRNTYEEHMVVVCIFSLPWLFLALRYYVMNRVAYECLLFMVFLIPATYPKKNRLSYYIIIFMLILYSFSSSILCAENNYYNYSTVFNDLPVSVQDFVGRRTWK